MKATSWESEIRESLRWDAGREEVAKATVEAMMTDEAEVISIYYGADVPEEDAEKLAAAVEEKYPDCEVELSRGGQPIYYYIVSVE